MKNTPHTRNFISIIIAIIVFLVVLFMSPMLYSIDKKAQGLIQEYFFSPRVLPSIIVVEIDDLSTQKLWRFPFDRSVYVPVIERLRDSGTAVIGFDIIFSDISNSQSDSALWTAISDAGNVVLWLPYSSRGFFQLPLDILHKWVDYMGYFAPIVDRRTNTVYGFQPMVKANSREPSYEHFSIALVRQYYDFLYKQKFKESGKYTHESYTVWNKILAPLSRSHRKEVLINYADTHDFKKVSLWELYDDTQFEILQKSSRSLDLQDSIIIIWATAKGLKDTFITPSGIEYGVYIHANIVNTILSGSYIKYFPRNLELLLVFLLILVSVYFNMSRSGKILIGSNIAIVSLFVVIFPVVIILWSWQLLNYWSSIILALIISLTVSNSVKYMIENKDKRKLSKALWEYVADDIVREVLSWEGNINLNGEQKQVTMFFSDIEGFTTISERFEPNVLVWFLREYLWAMSHIILDQKWFINKYEWDAIMALWWVFGKNEMTDYDACVSALKQRDALWDLNKKWEQEGFDEIKARIGIHSWDAIIGNIGATGRKMEFTALWDNVNLASRLEWVNKHYGTYICVSESVYKVVRWEFEFRFLDTIQVKWKEKPVKIYELLSLKWELSSSTKKIRTAFNKAMKLYVSWDFSQAGVIFQELLPQDPASKTYYDRCNTLSKRKNLRDWDGVWKMTEK